MIVPWGIIIEKNDEDINNKNNGETDELNEKNVKSNIEIINVANGIHPYITKMKISFIPFLINFLKFLNLG